LLIILKIKTLAIGIMAGKIGFLIEISYLMVLLIEEENLWIRFF